MNIFRSKIHVLTKYYPSCTRRLQPPRDDCAVRVLWFSGVRKGRGNLTRCVLLLRDNARVHTSQVAMTAAAECGFEILPHPPYSPSDFYLFPKLKSHLHGIHHGSNESVIEAVNEYLGDQAY